MIIELTWVTTEAQLLIKAYFHSFGETLVGLCWLFYVVEHNSKSLMFQVFV